MISDLGTSKEENDDNFIISIHTSLFSKKIFTFSTIFYTNMRYLILFLPYLEYRIHWEWYEKIKKFKTNQLIFHTKFKAINSLCLSFPNLFFFRINPNSLLSIERTMETTWLKSSLSVSNHPNQSFFKKFNYIHESTSNQTISIDSNR